MGNLFRYDSTFGRIMAKIADCVAISLLWIVLCLPGFTIGAATTALYYTAVKDLREDRGSPVKDFWKAFLGNFKQATLVFLAAVAACILWGLLCMSVYQKTRSSLTTAYVVYFLVLALGVMWLHYLFSYIARFRDTLSTVVKNSLFICLANFPYSLLAVTLFAMVLVVLAAGLPGSLWALLVVPGVYALLVSLILEPIYQKYLPDEESAHE